jgi:hypothetical protein
MPPNAPTLLAARQQLRGNHSAAANSAALAPSVSALTLQPEIVGALGGRGAHGSLGVRALTQTVSVDCSIPDGKINPAHRQGFWS